MIDQQLFTDPAHHKMPVQKPGRSKQDYGTPRILLNAIERRLGHTIAWDLAATEDNTVAPNYITKEQNSLDVRWHELNGLCFLNPPFGKILPWVQKCAWEAKEGAKIVLLVPASVGSNWYRDYIHDQAWVLFLNGRITFVGQKQGFPKDCLLAVYGYGGEGEHEVWRWK